MRSVTTIAFDDRKATMKEYRRTWNNFVGIISRLDVLKPRFNTTDMVENTKSKDGTYDDTVRKPIEHVPLREKGRTQNNGTKDDPMVLKAETLNKSK